MLEVFMRISLPSHSFHFPLLKDDYFQGPIRFINTVWIMEPVKVSDYLVSPIGPPMPDQKCTTHTDCEFGYECYEKECLISGSFFVDLSDICVMVST